MCDLAIIIIIIMEDQGSTDPAIAGCDQGQGQSPSS